MNRLTENKIVLITRKTRLDELITRFNTLDQARFYVENLGADFSDYQREDLLYKQNLMEASRGLEQLGRLQIVDRGFIPNFIFGQQDFVVVLGQDGLVANVLKYLDGQPVVGVNPDPRRWEGVLLPFTVSQLKKVLPQVFRQQRKIRNVTMALARMNTGETLHGVNDLFIGPRSHTSARYILRSGSATEKHSSSGIIVSTGLGSTGWFRSIVAGAAGITANLSGTPIDPNIGKPFGWDSDYLYFSVREPWPSKDSTAGITFGKVTRDTPLELDSLMPENGVIFSDGIEADYLAFNTGSKVTISIADKIGKIVI